MIGLKDRDLVKLVCFSHGRSGVWWEARGVWSFGSVF